MKKLVLKLLNQSYTNIDILSKFKRQWAKKHGFMAKNSQILTAYKKLVSQKKIKPKKSLEKLLRLKKIRSLSGIVPIAVLTKPYKCPGQCIYCPTQKGMPKSYLKDEPAVMRAKMANFDPYLQVKRRLDQLQITGHSTDKIELIVMGGTFSSLPKSYQIDFIKKCFDAANNSSNSRPGLDSSRQVWSKSLKQAQKINEKAKNRIIGLTLETRPDQITNDEIKLMRQLGATRVEIGVQSTDDHVLKKVKRGHNTATAVKATKMLKDAGFKVCYHMMPNLPGSSPKKDLMVFKTIFSDPRFKPDMLKIYPCVVVYQAKLYDWFKKGRFKPYSDKELIDLLIKIKKIVPFWVRINRLGRDIPISNIAAGNKLSNIRQVLQKKLKEKNIHCQCIRCREVREKTLNPNYSSQRLVRPWWTLLITNYSASGGQEYFLQFTSDPGAGNPERGRLYSLLRLRITSQKKAIIRELHTYGEALAIGKDYKNAPQHKGLGKKLLKKAEQIVKNKKIKKIYVIAGIGAREYYRKLGYKLENTYMVKTL